MTSTDKKKGGFFTSLVFLALLLTFAAVILSAYLRLEAIGLGCSDWPACFGQVSTIHGGGLVPSSPAGAIHRFAATLLGVVVLIITLMALAGRRPRGVGLLAPLAVFALTVFLSVLGYSTPSPDMPAVTLGNLGGGMAMLALLWWIGQRAAEPVTGDDRFGLRLAAILGLLLLVMQIALGAWTSAHFAGPSCTNLPGCEGNWQSLSNLQQGLQLFATLQVNDQGMVVTGDIQKTLHMAHRAGAIVTFLYLAVLAFRAVTADARFRGSSLAIIMLLLVQAGLGVSSILTGLPLIVVTLHNATAALLLLAVVNLNHLLTPVRR